MERKRMAKRRRKNPPRLLLLFDPKSQERFIGAVERLAGLVNDLERILAPVKRRRAAAAAATRAAAAAPNGELPQ
jgi:hypothetical protein